MFRILAFATIVALGLSSCDDEPTNPPDDGDFYLRITYSPAAANIPVGGNDVLQLQITRGGLYPGTITLATQGLPSTIIATFNPPILSGSADRASLTLTAGPGTVAGTCPFTISASGQDVETAVTPVISCAITGQ